MNKNTSEIILKGRFIIQKIYQIKISKEIDKDELFEIFKKKLPEFKRGNPEEEGFGFKIIEIKKVPDKFLKDPLLLDIFKNLIIIEFQKEKYPEIIIDYKDNKPIYGKKFPILDTNHIFIILPNYMIFKGSQSNLEFIESYVFNAMKSILTKREIKNV